MVNVLRTNSSLSLSALCQSRVDEAAKLSASNRVLAENHKEVVKKLSSNERRLQGRKEECNNLRIK